MKIAQHNPLFAFGLLALASCIASCGKTDGADPSGAAAPVRIEAAKPQPYKFDLQFDEIARSLVADDMAAFATGGDALLNSVLGVSPVAATEIARVYEQNQVAGDQRFYKKRLLVQGKVGSINSGLGNSPYVVYRDTGFIGLQAHLDAGQVADAAKLKKGQSLNLVCVGNGAIAGTPMLRDCQFAEVVAKAEGAKLSRDIEAFKLGKPVPRTSAILVVNIETIARSIPDEVDCSNGCLKYLGSAPQPSKEAFLALLEAMAASGLRVESAHKDRASDNTNK